MYPWFGLVCNFNMFVEIFHFAPSFPRHFCDKVLSNIKSTKAQSGIQTVWSWINLAVQRELCTVILFGNISYRLEQLMPPPPDREVKLLTGTEGANFYIDESDTEHNKEEEEIKKVSLFFTAWGHKWPLHQYHCPSAGVEGVIYEHTAWRFFCHGQSQSSVFEFLWLVITEQGES